MLRTSMMGGPLLSALAAGQAMAQSAPSQMPMGWQMMWGMGAVHVLGVIVLILAAAALIKYVFFR